SLNVSNFIAIKLTSINYPLWKEMAIGLADNQGLVGHLTGETPPPIKFEITGGEQTKTLSAAYIQWHSADRLLRSWLL
ncbi:hypothetical protein M569_12121, partial [Genlisea aurea]